MSRRQLGLATAMTDQEVSNNTVEVSHHPKGPQTSPGSVEPSSPKHKLPLLRVRKHPAELLSLNCEKVHLLSRGRLLEGRRCQIWGLLLQLDTKSQTRRENNVLSAL